MAKLNLHTAGGRVRYTTDSQYVAIKATMPYVTRKSHMPLSGTSGFDMYIDEESSSTYYGTFIPPVGMSDGYESILYFDKPAERKLTINFPLYNPVDSLYVGLQSPTHIGRGAEYAYKKPILYYGSSITQGGYACRTGNSYQAIISRRYNCDHINLGFAGNAKGEDTIVDYMSELDVSVFVCDYDNNAPTVEHLANTHERLYKKIRKKSPLLPIVLISKPSFDKDPSLSILRRNVIHTTFMNAIRDGDENVYYIDGQHLFKDENRDSCAIDGVHPNDAGFLRMAEVIGYRIGKIL